MDPNILSLALNAYKGKKSYAFATIVETTGKGTPRKPGAKMLVLEDKTSWGTIGGGPLEKKAHKECLKAIKTGQTKLLSCDLFGDKNDSICGGQVKIFIEPLTQVQSLIICGAGHIALPLSLLGKMLNAQVTILDNRKEFVNKKRFPHVDRVVVGPPQQYLKKADIDTNTSIVIVTHGHQYDWDCLKTVITSKSPYIAVIGSHQKKTTFLRDLKKENVAAKHLKKLHMPAGIDLGAQTPEEIAVSIAAEWIAFQNRALMGSVKFKNKKT